MNIFNFINRGGNTTANSAPVTLATDDAQVGTKVTAIPALGAGGAGLIGWLSTIVGKLAALGTNTMANSTPVTIATNDTQFAALLAKFPSNGLPTGATAFQVTTATVNAVSTATAPAVAAKTNYITKIILSGTGATAALLTGITISGVLGGNKVIYIQVPAGANMSTGPYQIDFSIQPLVASAANTAVSASCGAFGAGSAAQEITLIGYNV